MTKYVALVRGMGPGDPRKTNTKLVGVLESLGFHHVIPVISSGNYIFQSNETNSDKLEQLLEAAWQKQLGFEATTIVKSEQQLRNLLAANPFGNTPHSESSYLLVTFFKRPTQPDFGLPYQPPGKPYKLVGYRDNALFSITNNSVVKTSDLMTWLEKRFGKDITSRTPLTVERILKRMG